MSLTEEQHQKVLVCLAKLRADRAAFEGLPIATPLEIFKEAMERISLTPEAQVWFERGTQAGEGALGILLSTIAPNAPFVGLELKAIDFAFHLAWSLEQANAKTMLQAAKTQAEQES